MTQIGSGKNIEAGLPIVEQFGLNTAKPVDFSQSPSMTLPANVITNLVTLATIQAYAFAIMFGSQI